MKVEELATTRSGDKGSNVNIGVVAHDEKGYRILVEELSEERVKEYFAHLEPKNVKRYLWPGIYGLNFVLEGVLKGGGSANLHLDAQGKTLGVALLDLDLQNVE